jgi:hypothetical protein
MLAKLTSLAGTKHAKDEKAQAKADSTSLKHAAAAPDNVVGFFELGDLPKIQAVLGEVDDPVYKVRYRLLDLHCRPHLAPQAAGAACMRFHLL